MFIPKIRTKVNQKLLGTLIDPKSKRAYNGKYVVDYKGRITAASSGDIAF